MPTKPWQVRSPASAGSWRLAASGFFSRVALVKQYAWPPESVTPQIQQLREIYVKLKFPRVFCSLSLFYASLRPEVHQNHSDLTVSQLMIAAQLIAKVDCNCSFDSFLACSSSGWRRFPTRYPRRMKRLLPQRLRSNRGELTHQLQQAIGSHDAAAHFDEGHCFTGIYAVCSPLFGESFNYSRPAHVASDFTCQPPTHERQANLHQNFCQTLGRYSGSEVAEAVQFLISFIQQPSVATGEREIGLLAKALWASKIPYQHMFIAGAQEFAIPEEAMRVWEFPVQFFPGPPTSPHRWYICGHGTTPGGFLTAGRVFQSDADVVGTPPDQDCFSFYGKAMQWTNCVPGPTADSPLHKNSSGVVVGGILGCNHINSKSAATTHESHLCKYH